MRKEPKVIYELGGLVSTPYKCTSAECGNIFNGTDLNSKNKAICPICKTEDTVINFLLAKNDDYTEDTVMAAIYKDVNSTKPTTIKLRK